MTGRRGSFYEVHTSTINDALPWKVDEIHGDATVNDLALNAAKRFNLWAAFGSESPDSGLGVVDEVSVRKPFLRVVRIDAVTLSPFRRLEYEEFTTNTVHQDAARGHEVGVGIRDGEIIDGLTPAGVDHFDGRRQFAGETG